MNKKLFIIPFFSLLFACAGGDADKMSEIQLPDEAIALHGDSVSFSGELYRPAKLYIAEDKLVVFDDVKEDLFKVFGLPGLNYLYGFSNWGGGPDEFSMIDKEAINVSGRQFEILYRNKLYRYQVGDTSFIPQETNSSDLILTRVNPINNFKRLSDHSYVFNSDFQKQGKEFCLLNTSTKEERSFGEMKEPEAPELLGKRDAYYAKAICASEHQGRFAAFYYHRPFFSVYNTEGQLLKSVGISLSEHHFDPSTMYFVEPYATDDYIYVMWILMGKQQVEMDFNAFHPEILVFDWDGNFVNRLKLDRPIITFAVSERNKELYAVSFLDEDINKLYRFKLPE